MTSTACHLSSASTTRSVPVNVRAAATPSRLVALAVEDLLAGTAFTAPLVGSFVPRGEIATAALDVTAACALGALQIGYAVRLGQRRRDVEAQGLVDEQRALLDAYRLAYQTSLIEDNDRWGRDAVVARCKELTNALPPATDMEV